MVSAFARYLPTNIQSSSIAIHQIEMPRFVQSLAAMHLSCTNLMQPRPTTLSRPLRLLDVLPTEARPKFDTAVKISAMTLDGAVFTWQDNRVLHLTMPIRRINYIAVQSYRAMCGSRQARARFSSCFHSWTATQLPNRARLLLPCIAVSG